MKRILDWLYELFQPRRLGADWQDDERDYTFEQIKEEEMIGSPLPKSTQKFVRIKDQKRTMRCTAYAMSYVVEVMLMAHAIKNKKGWSRVYIDEDQLWENQILRNAKRENKPYDEMKRSMEKRGDWLHNALGSILDNGAYFYRQIGATKKKYHVTFGGYYRVDKDGTRKLSPLEIMKNCKKVYEKGHPTYSGQRMKKPWFIGWIINVAKNAMGGHCNVTTGPTDENLVVVPQSWGKKILDAGYSYIHGSKLNLMFGHYVLTGMKVREVTD